MTSFQISSMIIFHAVRIINTSALAEALEQDNGGSVHHPHPGIWRWIRRAKLPGVPCPQGLTVSCEIELKYLRQVLVVGSIAAEDTTLTAQKRCIRPPSVSRQRRPAALAESRT